jgi:xanthine dehydrogenase accessory factor
MRRETLHALREARRNRRSVALATDLATGEQALIEAQGRTGIVEADGAEQFIHVFQPTPRLVIVGAVHIAQKLAPLAQLAEFAVTIVDPREAFANAGRFGDTELSLLWPDRGVESLAPDSATAIVTLTHDPKLDDPALMAALRSPAFYIGALGSRKTHGRRLERLRAAGFGDADLARLRAPVGLPIGAVSPGEIAVSIMAEIVATLHGRALKAAEA